MKLLRCVIALCLALAMLASLTACHKQGEVALTVGDIEITSGLYSYYLVDADGEAKQIIDDSEDYDSTAKNFSYYKTTIEGVKFEEYVKNLALKKCREYAAYETLIKKAGTTAEEDSIQSVVDFYWETYGFKDIYEANGVGYDTYLKANIHEAKKSEYFLNIYREGGEKALTEAEKQKALDDHYAAIYSLEYSWGSEEGGTEQKAKEKLDAYAERLKKGETFEKLYNEYNDIKDSSDKEDNTSSTTSNTSSDSQTSSGSEQEKEPAPKDELLNVIGDEDTGYTFDLFSDIKAMKKDEVKVISDAENKIVYLVIKKDINSDSYYRDVQLEDDIISLLKEEDFKKEMDEYIDSLKYTVNDYAVNQFKVKKIYDGQ